MPIAGRAAYRTGRAALLLSSHLSRPIALIYLVIFGIISLDYFNPRQYGMITKELCGMGKKVQNEAALGHVATLCEILKVNLKIANLQLEAVIDSYARSNYLPGSAHERAATLNLNKVESEVELLKSLIKSVKRKEYLVLFEYYKEVKSKSRNLRFLSAGNYQHPVNDIIEALRVLSEDAK